LIQPLLAAGRATLRRLRADYRLARSRQYETTDYNGSCDRNQSSRIRVLFYCAGGLTFGGTEKSLQVLAKHLNSNDFEVLFMYSPQAGEARREYLQTAESVELVPFTYDSSQRKIPFHLKGMRPHIFSVLESRGIDIVVAAGTGYPEFPVANILNLPIVFLNIFGSISPQQNIRKTLCISDYLSERVSAVLPDADIETLYIQSEGPDRGAEVRGLAMRRALGLDETSCVFGRIGRPANKIFDPIGIRAFQHLLTVRRDVHYLIMAPPPELVQIVGAEQIPNVHFVPPSGKEADVWAFNHAIDALAHFRRDGETMGLNIAESMLCARPIITHKSRIYNAHLEYLDESFARVAPVDGVKEYAEFMREFACAKETGTLEPMGSRARTKAEPLFLVTNNIARFERYLKEVHALHAGHV
jgi:hypothetical protein